MKTTKKINENTKVTLTFKQLKRLIKESFENDFPYDYYALIGMSEPDSERIIARYVPVEEFSGIETVDDLIADLTKDPRKLYNFMRDADGEDMAVFGTIDEFDAEPGCGRDFAWKLFFEDDNTWSVLENKYRG